MTLEQLGPKGQFDVFQPNEVLDGPMMHHPANFQKQYSLRKLSA